MPPTQTKSRPHTRKKSPTRARTTGNSSAGPRRRGSPKRRHITPEDLLRFTSVSQPRVSPDGSAVVFTVRRTGEKNEYESNLWMVDTAGGEPRAFTSGGRDGQPAWSPDGTRLAFVGRRDEHRPQIWLISAGGGEAQALTRFPEGSVKAFRWAPDGRHLAVAFREQDPEWTRDAVKARETGGSSDPPRVLDHWWYRLDGDGYFNGQRYALYLVDVETGDHREVYRRDTLGLSMTFDFSPDSRRLVISSNRDRKAGLRAWNDDLLVLHLDTGRLAPVPGLPTGPKSSVAWSPDGRSIAYTGREGEDDLYGTENVELWVCDPVKGNARSLTGGEDYCLMAIALTDTSEASFELNIFWSPDSRRIYAQIGWQGETHLASVPRRGGGLTFHTSGPALHNPGNVSRDGRTIAMTVGTSTRLDEVHLGRVTRDECRLEPVTDLNGPLLSELKLARPRSRWIRAADGTRVQVWTMHPPERTPRRGPAVLEIHGGPHAQYGVGFFHEFQVLAAAGYTVVYSNPRGSKGYGRDHCAAIRGDWGNADWVDLQAVIEHMKSDASIDPRRMGVMGGSYGGYMTNWIIGHTHDFAGAITDRCVANLLSMSGNSDYADVPDLYWDGNAWDRIEARWRCSPIRHFARVRTPTLIIHSEGDLRCNIEQAEQVFTALSLRNVPARFVRYPRTTSHGMSRGGPPDMRLHRLEQILGWWARWLGKQGTKGRGGTKGKTGQA